MPKIFIATPTYAPGISEKYYFEQSVQAGAKTAQRVHPVPVRSCNLAQPPGSSFPRPWSGYVIYFPGRSLRVGWPVRATKVVQLSGVGAPTRARSSRTLVRESNFLYRLPFPAVLGGITDNGRRRERFGALRLPRRAHHRFSAETRGRSVAGQPLPRALAEGRALFRTRALARCARAARSRQMVEVAGV